MRINRNIVANYASRLWAGASSFVFLPLYLHILGPEPFGLVTFSATILGMIFVLDMGMSNAFAREMARETNRRKLGDLLRSLEWVYLAVIAAVLAFALLASGFIAEHWLNVSRLAAVEVRWSIGLMLVSAVLQVMMALYIGGLLGSNRHVAAAGYQIAFGFVRSGLVLLPLYFWRDVELVFAWQLAASLAFLLLLRSSVWRTIAPPAATHFSAGALRSIQAFAGGMFGIALISAINTQSDKFVVSKLFALDQLGLYSLAALLGQVPSMLALPLAVTVLPRLTRSIAQGEREVLLADYMRYSYMISTMAFTAAVGIIVGAPQLLAILTGKVAAGELVVVTRLLAAGGGFLAVQFMPYHLAVASGHTRTNVILGVASAVSLPIAMYAAASRFGLVGVAAPWLVMNFAAALVLALLLTPRFLGPHLLEWTWKANLLPFALSAAIVSPSILLIGGMADPLIAIVILAAFCGAAVAVTGYMLLRMFRELPTTPAFTMEVPQ